MKPSKETKRAEGRDQPEGISRAEARVRTQSRAALPPNLARGNAAAQQAARTRFTAVLHPVDIAALERAFRRQKRLSSAGVDGMTVAASEPDLEANLRVLCTRVHTRRYRPQRFPRLLLRLPTGRNPHVAVAALHTALMSQRVNWVLDADLRSFFASVDHEWLFADGGA